jgi:hypothetical protein
MRLPFRLASARYSAFSDNNETERTPVNIVTLARDYLWINTDVVVLSILCCI